MTGDDAVGVIPADGETCLGQVGGTGGHVVVAGPQVQRHFQLQRRDRQHTDHVGFQPIGGEVKAGVLVGPGIGKLFLMFGIDRPVILPHSLVQLRVSIRENEGILRRDGINRRRRMRFPGKRILKALHRLCCMALQNSPFDMGIGENSKPGEKNK